MRAGEHWYRMQHEDGKPYGYARLVIDDDEEGRRSVAWELHLVHEGHPYEEERTVRLDAEGRLLAATYATAGTRVEGERRGARWIGTQQMAGNEERALDLELPEDAVTGLGFLLATTLPREPGARLARPDFNEAAGFEPAGECMFEVEEEETLELAEGAVETWRVVLHRATGADLPLWVDEDGDLVQVDWGGRNLMQRSAAPTTGFFRPPPPAVEESEEGEANELVVAGTFEGVDPDALFTWWADADHLVRWWPQEAEVGDGEGGPYHMVWHEPAWFLRGRITGWEPGRRLAFTWAWDHAPDATPLHVEVRFEGAGDGTRVRIAHGAYADTPEDAEERAGHLRGWQATCARLRTALARAADG